MSYTIAVAGKGGVGKTTICGLLIDHLCKKKEGPVLAVDADANSNLNEVLGVEIGPTLGELREEIERAGSAPPQYQIPPGVTKADWLEMRMMDAVTEGEDFDLMVMGRSQGQGCYCFVNGLVQTQDDTVYRFDCDGRPMVELPASSPVRKALGEIIAKLGI